MAARQPVRPAAVDFDISTRYASGRILASVSGRLALEDFLSVLHGLGIASDGRAERCMLIDLCGVETVYAHGDLLRIGQEIACSFLHMQRLALLVQPERVTRISERSAREAGMNMGVFDSRAAALAWLSLDA